MMVGDNETVRCGNAVSVVGDRVYFDDDGWNPKEECFLTEEQCRMYHRLSSKQVSLDYIRND